MTSGGSEHKVVSHGACRDRCRTPKVPDDGCKLQPNREVPAQPSHLVGLKVVVGVCIMSESAFDI